MGCDILKGWCRLPALSLKKKKNFIEQKRNFKILVTVLLLSFYKPIIRRYDNSVNTCVKHAFHLLSLHHNGMIDRC